MQPVEADDPSLPKDCRVSFMLPQRRDLRLLNVHSVEELRCALQQSGAKVRESTVPHHRRWLRRGHHCRTRLVHRWQHVQLSAQNFLQLRGPLLLQEHNVLMELYLLLAR